jgi:predicted DNA repair protein MutK
LQPALFFIYRIVAAIGELRVAGSSLLALIDDIASILDDVAAMSKVAAKKTAGVLGDDLALNAYQVAGVRTERELPVVWAVAKGSLKNKVILVPAALAISALIPWAITALLMLGGVYLCYEGFEKISSKFLHDEAEQAQHAEHLKALIDPAADPVVVESGKIQGAIRTDFILSAEIIVIALGTVASAPFGKQVAVLCAIAVLMTIGVYGLVAAIVKLDDMGLHLGQKSGASRWPRFQRAIGAGLVGTAPYLMKALSIAGTVAMFMVGGGILTHGIPGTHEWIERMAQGADAALSVGPLLVTILPSLLDIGVGIFAGALVLLGVSLTARYFSRLTFAG